MTRRYAKTTSLSMTTGMAALAVLTAFCLCFFSVRVQAGRETEESAPGVTFSVTKEGEHFFLCDRYKKALPQTVLPGETLEFAVFIDSGYEAGAHFAVKVNGVIVKAAAGMYLTGPILGDTVISVEDVVKQDSASKESPKDKNDKLGILLLSAFGVCLAGLTAYIGWFSKKAKRKKAERKTQKNAGKKAGRKR